MSTLTKEFLESIGVEMDEETLSAFDEHFEESLLNRIIDQIVRTLNDDQARELAQLNSDAVWQWLQANVPNLGEIVRQETDTMLTEVVRTSDHL